MAIEEFAPPANLFVGRERERALIAGALAALPAGHGHLVLVAGDAGIGKTALMTAMAQQACTDGMRVLTGRCYDTAPPPPYGLWLDLFRRYPTDALAVPPPAPFAYGNDLTSIDQPAVLAAQLSDWLVALSAARPLVIGLEDLHWADLASLELLRVLARTLASLPVLVLATYRARELDRVHPLYLLLPRLVREANPSRLTLRPLTETEVAALVRQRYTLPAIDVDRLAAYLSARAEGNALFTLELLHTLEESETLHRAADGWVLGDLAAVPVPTLLRQMIDERVRRLGEPAHELLELASAIGQEVPLAWWAQASGADEGAVLAVAEQAIAAAILAQGNERGRVRFVHALTREALYAGIPLVRRRLLHARIAAALIEYTGADPGTVAYHLQEAGDRRALDWFLVAAKRAEHANAFAAAIDYLEAAIALLAAQPATEIRRAEIDLRISHLGRFSPWTVPYIQEALHLAAAHGDTTLVAVAQLRLGFALALGLVDFGAVLNAQLEALALLESLPPDALAALNRIDHDATSLSIMRLRTLLLAAASGRIADVFRETGVSANAVYTHRSYDEGSAYVALSIAYLLLGRADEANVAADDDLAWLRRIEQYGIIGAIADWHVNEVGLVFAPDNPGYLAARTEVSALAYRQDRTVPDVFPARIAAAGTLILHGKWDEALTLIAQAQAVIGMQGWYGLHLHRIGQIAHARGERVQAEAVVHEVFPRGPRTEPGGLYLPNALRVQRLAATLALDSDDTDTARRWLDAHDRWLAWSGAVLEQAEGHLAWASWFAHSGDLTRALAEAERGLALATNPRQPLALLAAHRLRGELLTAARRYDEARTHLDAALALADACNAPYERALTLIARAPLRAALGNDAGAAADRDEAHVICSRLGARQALARLASLGAAADTARDMTLGVGLTEREYEVLTLLARGGTNAGIARTLSLSARTVERHIANIYAKIGAHSRTEALAFAMRFGLGAAPAP